ncbi:MAG: hypothetical protein UW46_C0003G0045 [Candidatus Yanofskybacteria bacterium GW2011_GWF1_44_227]|uniref:Uncharacterized protein n=1 Tax=Candidatus Yanofskybacteria bacterium GW2011_GWE2_40_11 TaxID=1619033 RepID=A0A0G0QV54_9BACT|nr:MAG: hypothetical protein UT69_C0008G0013 [Candidatus Yanofskybacteria bacterium GW2011_GWE1_40_10]KKR41236.1 MAG: hypothetical protein UT75_C0001G0140 [Candidatus Yanofskybacteria bacterium GW2011_GWE2_40_11]KKT15688.1 MAG: hypothetical protein UV97_C0003G0020 [Candidatus Yanofskybacteria bacterium GW2011_GWF2_43_596]KKT53424.1 MAG: hypothetical protein UW46_C0003G0045 [Candidatus Yanofskybacteria bacterium GW2011_GWF1_44_227]OGN38325.1 MAG: hypothetical protein A2405_01170 [Candidatus Yano
MAETYFSHEKTTREIIGTLLQIDDPSIPPDKQAQITSNLAIAQAILTLAAAVHEQTEVHRNSSNNLDQTIRQASYTLASK